MTTSRRRASKSLQGISSFRAPHVSRHLTLAITCCNIGYVVGGTFEIGVVSPMSGPQASTGQGFVHGLEWWRNKVNAAGGLLTKDGQRLHVVLHVADTMTNSTLAAEQVVLFNEGLPVRVDALVNTFTLHNVAVNEAMRTHQVRRVLMHCSGGTPAQYGDIDLGIPRWNYQFGVMIPSRSYAISMFKTAAKQAQMLPNLRVAFIKNTANPFTSYTCDESVIHARELGLEVADIWTFDGQANDDNRQLMEGWIRSMKASETQILLGCTWLQDGIMVQQAILKEKIYLAMNIILIAPTTAAWREVFPRDSTGKSEGDYVLSPSQWHHTQNFNCRSSVGPTKDFAAEFRNATGSSPDYLLASCTAAGIILERAMAQVNWGHETESSLRSDMLQGMVRDFMDETMYGAVRFDRHNQNVGHDAAVIQVQPGKGQTSVLPESNSESILVFPIPTWESREGCPQERPVNDGFRCIEADEDGTILWIGVAAAVSSVVVLAIVGLYCMVQSFLKGIRARRQILKQRLTQGLASVNGLGHPMVLISMLSFLDLSWEDVRSLHEGLRDTGKIIVLDSLAAVNEFKRKGREVVFFSYQWLSWNMSGPSKLQFECMCSALKLHCRQKGIATSEIFVWLDIFGIPQLHEDLKSLAVSSLYCYASAASALIIICPTSLHEQTGETADAQSYKSRVWCRAEQLAHFSRAGIGNMYICTSAEQLEPCNMEWIQDVVCVFGGEMTCCRLQHPHDQSCDRESLVPALMALYFVLYTEHRSGTLSEVAEPAWRLIQRNKEYLFPKKFEYKTGSSVQTRELFGPLIRHIEKLVDQNLSGSLSKTRQACALEPSKPGDTYTLPMAAPVPLSEIVSF